MGSAPVITGALLKTLEPQNNFRITNDSCPFDPFCCCCCPPCPCPLWLQVSGAITFLRTESMCYPACPNKVDAGRQCNKKLMDNGNGEWWVGGRAGGLEGWDNDGLLACLPGCWPGCACAHVC